MTYNPKNLASERKKILEISKKCNNNFEKIKQALEQIIKNRESDKNNITSKNLSINIGNERQNYQKEKSERDNDINIFTQKLKESYTKLNPKLKQATPQEIQQAQKAISPENQRKLKKAGIQPQEYAQFLLTKEAIFQHDEKTPETREFLDALKTLESSLGLKTDRI